MSQTQLVISNDSKPNCYQNTFKIKVIDSNSIILDYSTLPGNLPKTNANMLVLWQNLTMISSSDKKAPKQHMISQDSQSNTIIFSDLTIQYKPYVLGYCMGSDPKNICGTAAIPVSSLPTSEHPFGVNLNEIQYHWTSIQIQVENDVLSVTYITPPGNCPKTNGHWIGFWKGPASPYEVVEVTRIIVLPEFAQDYNQGAITYPYSFGIGTQYTIAYFTGGRTTSSGSKGNDGKTFVPTPADLKTAACFHTFTLEKIPS